ncbi:hypothetical protein EYC95_02425 [Pseudomonas sp. BGI-2]|nr:hypothetical protein EYC95_02425 [Pseudomonas sp. BGI-2]
MLGRALLSALPASSRAGSLPHWNAVSCRSEPARDGLDTVSEFLLSCWSAICIAPANLTTTWSSNSCTNVR